VIEEPEPEVSEEENTELEENNQELNEEVPTEDTEEITEEEVPEPQEIIVNYVYSVGNEIGKNKITDELEVRPTLYLKSRILLVAGEGTFDNPYIIK